MLLDTLLEELDVDVEPFAVCDVAEGFGLRLAGRAHVTLHFVVEGRGRLVLSSGTSHDLAPHHLAVVPEQVGHVLESGTGHRRRTDGRQATDGEGVAHLVAGGQEEVGLRVACGRLAVSYRGGLDVFRLLDEALLLDFSDTPTMRATFHRLLEESSLPTPGRRAMMAALMSQCLVAMFRRLASASEGRLPWLVALEDERLADVLEVVLDDPGQDHTVESLAHRAAMSRSAFAAHFSDQFGVSPMAFVRDLRMHRAATMLRTTSLPVATVARRVGYASRSHFSGTFTEVFGAPPSEFRSQATAAG